MTNSTRTQIVKMQAILTKIDMKIPVFFNITQYKNNGLVKEHGKTIRNTTNWILTEKGKQFLNLAV